jgi:hypothetical protein
METTDIFREFVTRHWPSGEAQWFNYLAKSGWIGADWPFAFGGTGWTRHEQLTFITVLSEHRCPVMPDSVNVIAPMLLAFGSAEQKNYFLPRIHGAPEAYTFQVQAGASPGCLLDHDSGSLFLISDDGSAEPFGEGGEAEAILALSYSPLWLLYEKLLGLAHLKKMNEYWEEKPSTVLAEIQIETSSLTGFFLQETDKADSQIGLRVNRDRDDLYASLLQSLGYYALLSPDSTLNSNEPLPFSAEREYLQTLRKQVTRNNMIQQDRLYREHVNYEDT